MKTKIIALLGILTLLITGCNRGDFIDKAAEEFDPGLSLGDGNYSDFMSYEYTTAEISNPDYFILKLKKALEATKFSKYTQIKDYLLMVDLNRYASDVLTAQGYEIQEDNQKFEESRYSSDSNYTIVRIDNFICVQNITTGKLLDTRIRTLLSYESEFINAVKEAEMPGLAENIIKYDKELINTEDVYRLSDFYTTEYSGHVSVYDFFGYEYNLNMVREAADYLTDYYAYDQWTLSGASGNNSACEYVQYIIEDNEKYITLDVFGKDNEVKEIRLKYLDGKAPVYGSATISNLLEAMGASETDIKNILNKMPDKTGKLDTISYIVEDDTIKFY